MFSTYNTIHLKCDVHLTSKTGEYISFQDSPSCCIPIPSPRFYSGPKLALESRSYVHNSKMISCLIINLLIFRNKDIIMNNTIKVYDVSINM